MAIVTGSWLFDFLVLVGSLLGALILYYKKQFRYWGDRGVAYQTPSFPLGNMSGVITERTTGVIMKEWYDAWQDERYVGLWMATRPALLIRDPEIVKDIFVRDFMSFHDRGVYVNEKDDPLAAHLFSIGGAKWRNMRTKLSPTFTSGKMKMMFPTLVECSELLIEVLQEPANKKEVIEVKEYAARFTTDVISSCAFGIQTNSLKNPDAIFRTMGRKIFEPTVFQSLKAMALFFVPSFAKALRLTLTEKSVSDFFLKAVQETMDYRESNDVKRNDFMQLLIQLKNKGKLDAVDEEVKGEEKLGESTKFTFHEAAAQAFVFFAAGFETSSTTMQFALYEICKFPEVQIKARAEVLKVLAKYNGKVTYESLHEMEYLGRVIDETLRKYPPVPILQRECNKDFKIPNSNLVIPKGLQVQIPIFGMQTDPKHFPDPEKFDPDRFTEEEKAKRHHYAYLPFGEGPRNCIGMRFGIMQSKVGLATLLSNFRFELCKESPNPVEFESKSFILSPVGGMNLRISHLNK